MCNGKLQQGNFQCIGCTSTWNCQYNRMEDWKRETSSVVVVMCICVRSEDQGAIDLLLLGEEGLYVPDMDAEMETELADGYDYTICTQ